MKQSRKERLIENDNVRFATQLGVESIKLNPLGSNGYMDRMYFVPGGRPLLIEYKDPGGKVSQLQRHRISALRGNGYDVHVIDDKMAGRELIADRIIYGS